MSLAGFEVAAAHGELHTVAGVQLRVVNLPGLVALKLFALRDRVLDPSSTDLADLAYILSNASDALAERVYEELEPVLLERLDYKELGPYLLGRDVASIFGPDEVTLLLGIIDRYVLTPPDYAALSRTVSSAEVEGAIVHFGAFGRGLANSANGR